jgi:4-amino-4-deoxy-L-arabinose transferase-like glycosyltransferase
LANILIWIFPWTVVLPAALREAIPRSRSTATRQHRVRLLVGLWALTVIAFFSLSSSKLEHYFLPAIVPLSLMAGKVWADEFSSAGTSTILKWSFGIAALVFPLLGGGLLFLGFRLTPDDVLRGLAQVDIYYRILWTHGHGFAYASVSSFVPLVIGVGAVFVIGFPLAFALLHFQLPRASFATLLGVGAVIGLIIFRLVLLLEPFHSAKSTARVLSARLEPGDRIVYEGDLSYAGGIPFYTGQKVYVLNGRKGDLEFGSYYPEAKHLFLDNASFARLWEGDQQVFLVTRFPVEQSLVRYFPKAKIFLVGRYGSYWLYANRSVGTEQQFDAAR